MKGMSLIVRTIANISFPFILIYGFYIIAHGHLTPGGGFQGGAVVASGLVLMLIAYNAEWISQRIKESHLSIFESLGALSFVLLAFLGIIFGTAFFSNFLVGTESLFGGIPLDGAANINTGGIIPLMNFAVGLKVIAGLFAIVYVMAHFISKKEGKIA
ncbi:sodium:proton antiporter [Thermoplasmatales archaeon ex4572_165]|nr:MAG: sodium:proton antiporter [Thermoplasmatales archaeon ex4572_165]RLF58914.1 MAG: sodium:proton antiporter [Thermoplasmata archaeon]